jgi:hypothetical protein
MGSIPLDEGERSLGSWTILYLPPGGGRYNGSLNVTDRRLIYDAKFDVSASGVVEEALFMKQGSEGYVVIPKERIRNVEAKKSFLAKKAVVTLDDGQEHVFNYGMMNIDKVVDAINQR